MFGSELESALTAMGLSVTEEQLRQFDVFHEQLIETNKVMNLTAITEPKEVAIKHMADSLSCYEADCFMSGASVLDLGTGAGFPGLPLLIYRPDLKVTFFDSLQKRLTFLQNLVDQLGLTADFLHGRAEEAAHQPIYRSAFDVVTSRAVARLNILAEWALPYVKQDGYFISLKGAQYEDELKEAEKALKILGGTVARVKAVQLPGLDEVRAIIYIRKTGESPKKYPRKPKMAVKNPL
ncbi:16S rRNA (guanine(527)-N(7))-methyltransferase RsmG [uncultured Megasphaera sp.]|uniref:16S rRNA (guanine(527)-N(7))-methyltransferase RsmG n=1 Tax=uncultured Megasphaera sp. TaxID=165188 RepID=UPI00266D7299|nr:16S rRNA (guanine(527)-N(7))-methyltransferase RsmG [uncultured Megasphaera sp.]